MRMQSVTCVCRHSKATSDEASGHPPDEPFFCNIRFSSFITCQPLFIMQCKVKEPHAYCSQSNTADIEARRPFSTIGCRFCPFDGAVCSSCRLSKAINALFGH